MNPKLNTEKEPLKKVSEKKVNEEREKLAFYRVYLNRYVSKTFNKLSTVTFGLGFFSSEGILLDLYPKDSDIQKKLFGDDIQVGSIWKGIGHNAVSEGLQVRRSRKSVGDENEAVILKRYAVYFSVINMFSIYSPEELREPRGVAIITPLENARDDYWCMAVGIAHDVMLNVQFRDISTKYYERSGKGILVVDSFLTGENIITYYNDRLLHILGLEDKNLNLRNVEMVIDSPPDNKELWDIIAERKAVNDIPVTIRSGGRRVDCILSTDAYYQPSIKTGGLVMYLTTPQRIAAEVSRKMANGAVKTFDDIIGGNQELLKVIERARRMAKTESNIMILGESGTGKDVFAQAIHLASRRCNNPFIALNCGALPHDLIESELFGYEGGSFTGARKNGNLGKFELAMGGTIFLDEIGEMPLDLQAKLLRVVEQKQIMRIGGTRMIDVDVKIIAATNVDIWAMIQQKLFREDLFYRLSTMRLNLMPLRERRDDIPVLADYFIHRISEKIGKKNIMRLSEESKDLLMSMEWRGNVRELQNLIECIVQLYPGDIILPEYIKENASNFTGSYQSCRMDPETDATKSEREDKINQGKPSDLTKEDLLKALKLCGNNRSKAAEHLNISRRTLYRKLEEFKLTDK